MTNLTAARQARAHKRLDTTFRYAEGVMSEREFMKMAFRNGWTCELQTWTDVGTWKQKEGYVVNRGGGTSTDVSKAAFDYFEKYRHNSK